MLGYLPFFLCFDILPAYLLVGIEEISFHSVQSFEIHRTRTGYWNSDMYRWNPPTVVKVRVQMRQNVPKSTLKWILLLYILESLFYRGGKAKAM